jgi:hypothetical protein
MKVTERQAVDHGVIEADGVPWDVPVLVTTLRDRRPGMKLIGLFKTRPVPCDGLTLLPLTAAPRADLSASAAGLIACGALPPDSDGEQRGGR